MRTICLFLFLCLCQSIICLGQELISSACATGKSSQFEMNWSIGETITETFSSTQLIMNQGYHQSVISVIESGEEFTQNHTISIYPNPTSDKVFINFENFSNAKITLFDVNGRVVFSRVLFSNISEVDLSLLYNSVYLMVVDINNVCAKSVKIIKTPKN